MSTLYQGLQLFASFAVARSKYDGKSSSIAPVVDKSFSVNAKCTTVIFVDSTGYAVPIYVGSTGTVVLPAIPKGYRAVVDSAADAEPAELDGKGIDTDANALPGPLIGTAVVVDSDASEERAIPKGTTDADAEVGIPNGTAVVAEDSAATPERPIPDLCCCAANAETATLVDGTTVVMVSAADAEQAIRDGTAVVVDCNSNEVHRTTASYGDKAVVVILVAGGAVIGYMTLPAAGLAALSSFGFTSIGPSAGSFASACMSSIAASNGVGVTAGSLYALLQSTAMTGGGWLLGTASTTSVGAAMGGGVAWLSSKLRRTTTSSSEGRDDVEEQSQERCMICGLPVAAATSRA